MCIRLADPPLLLQGLFRLHGSPSSSVHVLPSPSLSVQPPRVTSSFDRNCSPSPAPLETRGSDDNLSHNQPHELCEDRGYDRKDSKAALKLRLTSVDDLDRNWVAAEDDAIDTTETLARKRNLEPVDAADNSGVPKGK